MNEQLKNIEEGGNIWPEELYHFASDQIAKISMFRENPDLVQDHLNETAGQHLNALGEKQSYADYWISELQNLSQAIEGGIRDGSAKGDSIQKFLDTSKELIAMIQDLRANNSITEKESEEFGKKAWNLSKIMRQTSAENGYDDEKMKQKMRLLMEKTWGK